MKKITLGLMALSLATCLSTQSNAAGFFIQEQSVSGLGSAFAGSTVMARDASTIFYNPAGMTYLEGTNGNIGVHFLAPSSDLDDTGSTLPATITNSEATGNPYDIEPVPNAYLSHQLTSDTWVGVGITAPFGLANEYDEDFFGRFDSTSTDLLTLDIQPSVAHKINERLSIGGGLDIQYADAELKSAAVLGAGVEGESIVEGDDISFGYNLGMIYELSDQTKFGLHYRSQVNHKLDGDVTVDGAGITSPGEANLNLPEIASLSFAHDLNDQWTLMGGATWFGWSNFERITVNSDNDALDTNIDQNYKNTWAFNIGAEYEYSPEWTFRGGLQYDETPTQDGFRSTRTPDGDRIWVSGGATYGINEKMSLDLAATYINVGDEDISLTRTTATGPSNIEADSSGHVGILAVGLNYKF